METGWDDPDHGAVHAVENESFADDVIRGPKLAPPQTFGEHHSRVRAQAVFVRGKGPSPQWSDSQNLKEAGGDHLSPQAVRLSGTGEIEPGGTVRRHRGERAVHLLPVLEIWIGNGAVLEIWNLLKHQNKPLPGRERQQIDQNAIPH